MTFIQIDPLGTTTLMSTTSTLDDTVQDSDAKSTTIAGLATSLTTSMSRPESTYIYMSNHYIDSLTDEEIIQMEERLADKEHDFLISLETQQEKPKVLIKTNQV